MKKLIQYFKPISILALAVWAVFLADLILPWNLLSLGIYPRSIPGLIGIPLHPFLHANLLHLLSNTVPLVVLSWLLLVVCGNRAYWLMMGFILLEGFLVWIFGRPAIHIGASGLIYAEAAFLVAMGIFANRFVDILIAVLVIVLYGGMVWGVLPLNPFVSWEGHLMGAVAGVFFALQMRKSTRRMGAFTSKG